MIRLLIIYSFFVSVCQLEWHCQWDANRKLHSSWDTHWTEFEESTRQSCCCDRWICPYNFDRLLCLVFFLSFMRFSWNSNQDDMLKQGQLAAGSHPFADLAHWAKTIWFGSILSCVPSNTLDPFTRSQIVFAQWAKSAKGCERHSVNPKNFLFILVSFFAMDVVQSSSILQYNQLVFLVPFSLPFLVGWLRFLLVGSMSWVFWKHS